MGLELILLGSMTIRTACSAALMALNEACAALSRGDCEGAIVGGVNLILAPSMTAAMTEQGFLSKDGWCKSFSADANGYARGEAATTIYIKPLAHAIRDGNPIRAVIRATSHNADGKTPGLTQPSTDAQEALIRRAYQLAGITDYSKTAMVECHGTGTPIGDPIEAKAVARVFGDKGVYIGSVKPNVGHTEGASGLVSLIKMVKALENRTIPPNIRFTTPNPKIPFKEAKLTVPVKPTPWPEDRFERISLNSFGVGGANAHVIVESAATFNASPPTYETPDVPQLLLYTANSTKSLASMIEIYRQWTENNPTKTADLAYTLATRREHLHHRAFAIVNNGAIESVSSPTHVKSAQQPNVVMVFTGQGAQWPQMGRELLQSSKTFKSSIKSLDQHLQSMIGENLHYSIEMELMKPPKKSRLSSAELSQPLCTAIQIALVDTLKFLGIIPNAVVGHSSGEIAAAYASGALTAGESIIAAHHRGAVTARQIKSGSMAAVGMSWEETEKYLTPNVTIACDNSPMSVTISGDADAVKAVVADIQKARPDVLARPLQVDKAYHSYHMREIGGDYLSLISNVTGNKPLAPFFSSVTGNLLEPKRPLGPKYWQANLESPVRFREAVTCILNHEIGKNAVFLEIGPHSALAGPLRQIFTQVSSPAPSYISTMIRNKNTIGSFLTAVGKLFSHNIHVDLKALFPTGTCLSDLPRYPWNHENSYWFEYRLSKEWRHRKFPYHDLLGVKVSESTDLEPMWRNLLHLANVPWIRDHRVRDDTVFPFAGYIALAGEAVRQLTEINDGFSMRNIHVNTALILNEGKPTEMITTFRPHRLTTSLNSPWWEFTVASYNGHLWTKHCTGEITALSPQPGTGQVPEALPRKLSNKRWYQNVSKGGVDLGPCFQTLEAIETSTNSDLRAIGKIINGRQGDEANYHIHPTVLDGFIQLVGAAAVKGYTRNIKNWLPTSVDQISVYRCPSDMISSASATLSSNGSVIGHCRCISKGVTVVEALGMKLSLAESALPSDLPDTHAAARYEWASDITFMDSKELIHTPLFRAENLRLLEELGHLCLLSSKRQLAGSKTNLPHLQKYMAWIISQSASAVMNLASDFKSPDDEVILTQIEDLVARLSDAPAAPAAKAIHHIFTNMDSILSGQTLDNILGDEILQNLYVFLDQPPDRSQLIQNLGHIKPNLRVLEIGNGRGLSPAGDIIDYLTHANGQFLCSRYTFTSPGFVSVKDQNQIFPNIEFASLDISQSLVEQGFEDRQYDFIVATNILHATNNLQASLANVKKLLVPDGLFYLQELCPSSKWVNYVFGVLPNWWLDAADGRAEEPSTGIERWRSELVEAGFDRVEEITHHSEKAHQLTTLMISRQTSSVNAATKSVTVLYNKQGAITARILNKLRMEGYLITECKLGDPPPKGQDVVSLLDIEKPFFENIDELHFQSFKDFIHGLKDAGVLWVTHASEIGCHDPRYAQVLGLARVIRSEMLADFATCEVENFDDARSADNIFRVFAKFQTREADNIMGPDYEWAIRNGQIQVGRFYPAILRDELRTSAIGEKAILDVATPGRVNSLHWVRQPREDLRSGEVEVQVHSAGLNFRVSRRPLTLFYPDF